MYSAPVPDVATKIGTLTLSGDVELSRLVELVAREASVSIEYAPADLAKRITLRVREALTARQLWDVLAATLEGQGLVIVRTERAGVYRVVPVAQAAAGYHMRP